MPTGSRQLLGVWQRFRPDAPGAGHAVRHRQRTGPTELESSFRVGAGPKVSAGLTVQPMRVPGTPFPWPGQGHKTRRPRDRPQRQDIRNERIREEGSKVGLRCTTGCTDRDQARGVERSHRLETLHRELPGPVADLPEIPSHLHPRPSFRCRAEGFRQPYRHLDRNSRALVQEFGKRPPRDAQPFGRSRHAEAKGFKALPPHDAARMRRVMHPHARSPR